MTTIQYKVPSISCRHCAHTIQMELQELDGVKTIEVDIDRKEVNVVFDLPATPEKIEQLLTEINYPVEKF